MYCGIDIIEVDRIKDAVQNTPKFKDSIFSALEIENIDRCSEKIKYQRYAGRFAAKEAVFKALSKILTDNNLKLSLNEIEIINEEDYFLRPKVNIINLSVKEKLKHFTIDVSISHIEKTAVASCVVQKTLPNM